MGVFVKEDGYYHGWLAGILCCCAALGPDEHPAERHTSDPTASGRINIVYDQPPAYQLHPYPYPNAGLQHTRSATRSGYHDRPGSTDDQPLHPPHLKPLDFGPTTLFAHRLSDNDLGLALQTRTDAADHAQIHQGLIPLRLAPVALRTPEHDDRSIDTSLLPPPFATDLERARYERQSSEDASVPSIQSTPRVAQRDAPTQRLISQDSDDRSSTVPSNFHAVQTLQPNEDAAHLDDRRDGILSNHVPAVAPSMQMHVRSETLNDIGSAFSRPITARSDHKNFDELLQEQDGGAQTRENSRPRPASQVAKLRSRSASRVSGWLTSIRASNAPAASMPDPEHVNQHSFKTSSPVVTGTGERSGARQRSRMDSQPSWSSSSTSNIDSQSGAAASTPTTNTTGHSRNVTAESLLSSPPSTTIGVKTAKNDHGSSSHNAADSFAFDSRTAVVDGNTTGSSIIATEQACYDAGWLPLHQATEQVGVAL